MRLGPVALLALLAIFWGANWPIMKVGVAEVPPWTFRLLSSGFGGIGLLAIAMLGGHGLRVPRREWRGLALAALLNIALWNILVMYGIDLMNSGRAAILAYTMPLWATIASVWLLAEPLSARRAAGLALGMGGMALLFVGGGEGVEHSLAGPALVVLAAMAWGVGTAVVKRANFSMPLTVAVGWQHLLGTVPIAVVALGWDIHRIESVSAPAAFSVVYNMTVTAIFCYWAYFKVVTTLPIVVSTVGTLAVPVLGVAFTALWFREPPLLTDYLALAAVVGAVGLVLWPARGAAATGTSARRDDLESDGQASAFRDAT